MPVQPATMERSFTPGERGLEQSFGRAAVLLNALADAGATGLRFVDLVRRSGFSQTTVHRLVAALAEHGFIEQEAAGGRYHLGMRLAGWAFAAANRFGLAEVAHPVMQALSEATQDTVYLTLRSGDMAICVSRIDGTYPIRAVVTNPGDRRVLGLGAGSVALLAFLQDRAEIERLLLAPEQRAGRAAHGVDDERLRHWIEASRRDGYTLVQDLVPGTTGIGQPIFGPAGDPVASLSLAAISARLQPPRRQEVLQRLQAARAEIERRLRPILNARTALTRA
ncbi:IclR family transcriptional regulator [Roseicella sp. DB1501]|uniref:IclR family transcriptional regulator n=1 Tax=Roseicella sp. DB1501 TaxID=2730925 RepID=UPI0014914CEA|nr:IclR family transcriptional regulator [Roseicella sp. DB1501]NOG69359.1 IclR family transcriptional regulator [Roseicella sp. DB1501]